MPGSHPVDVHVLGLLIREGRGETSGAAAPQRRHLLLELCQPGAGGVPAGGMFGRHKLFMACIAHDTAAHAEGRRSLPRVLCCAKLSAIHLQPAGVHAPMARRCAHVLWKPNDSAATCLESCSPARGSARLQWPRLEMLALRSGALPRRRLTVGPR